MSPVKFDHISKSEELDITEKQQPSNQEHVGFQWNNSLL